MRISLQEGHKPQQVENHCSGVSIFIDTLKKSFKGVMISKCLPQEGSMETLM